MILQAWAAIFASRVKSIGAGWGRGSTASTTSDNHADTSSHSRLLATSCLRRLNMLGTSTDTSLT